MPDRLLFALWPDEPTRNALAGAAAHLRNKLHPLGGWIDVRRYQLPLHLLGDYPVFPEALAQRAADAAAGVCSPEFTLCLDQARSSGTRSMAWHLAPAQVPQGVKGLWRELRDRLQAQAVPYDTRLRLAPQVTVLRDAGQVLASTPVPPVAWAVRTFALIHSGPVAASGFRVLASWPLAANRAPQAGPAQRELWDT